MDKVIAIRSFGMNVLFNGFNCNEEEGLDTSLHFFLEKQHVHAISGCGCDDASMAVGVLANLYRIPMVSCTATGADLSDKSAYILLSNRAA